MKITPKAIGITAAIVAAGVAAYAYNKKTNSEAAKGGVKNRSDFATQQEYEYYLQASGKGGDDSAAVEADFQQTQFLITQICTAPEYAQWRAMQVMYSQPQVQERVYNYARSMVNTGYFHNPSSFTYPNIDSLILPMPGNNSPTLPDQVTLGSVGLGGGGGFDLGNLIGLGFGAATMNPIGIVGGSVGVVDDIISLFDDWF